KFTERNKKSLEEHSGLMITDFDQIPTQKDFDEVWNKIVNIKSTVFCFESPSNGSDDTFGIKALIKIPKCTQTCRNV
ncbi:MAG: BT4734/BF3469 family protein, partial [Candidatus Syntrophosphaera sp.]